MGSSLKSDASDSWQSFWSKWVQRIPVPINSVLDFNNWDYKSHEGPNASFVIFLIVESNSNHAGVQMPVDVVIADDLLAPTFPVLHRYHVPFYSFNSGSVGRLLHYLSITAATPTCSDPERVPFIEVPAVEGCQPPAVLEIFKKVYLPLHETIHLARGVICNAVDEMEEEFVKRVKKHPDMAGVALYTVGPLFQDDGPRLNVEKHDATTQGSYGFRTHFLNSTGNTDERSEKYHDAFSSSGMAQQKRTVLRGIRLIQHCG